MPNDSLDALFEANPVTVTPATVVPNEPAATPPQAEPQGPDRDEAGRFKAKEAAQPQAVEPVAPSPSQPVAQPEQSTKRPLTEDDVKAIIEYRQKWQEAEKRAKTAEERLQQREAPQIPDFMSDPEGYAQHLQTEVQRTALNSRFETSEVVAREKYGDDPVQQAMDWGMAQAGQSRAFAAEYVQQRHPVDWIVKRYKRDQIINQLGDKDPVEWAKELLAAQSAQAPPQAQGSAPSQIASPQAAPLPSASLASARSAGGVQSIPIGPDAAFTAMFPK